MKRKYKTGSVPDGLLPISLERTLFSAAVSKLVLRSCSAAVERKKVQRVEAEGKMSKGKESLRLEVRDEMTNDR